MADGSKIMPFLLLGGAAFAAYEFFFKGAPAAAVASNPVVAPPAGGKLDVAFAAMVQKAGPNASGSVDDWNSWLMQGTPAIVAPDPMPVFQAAIPGFDRAAKFSAADYWRVMSPVLSKQYGLSGLGFYGSVLRGIR